MTATIISIDLFLKVFPFYFMAQIGIVPDRTNPRAIKNYIFYIRVNFVPFVYGASTLV